MEIGANDGKQHDHLRPHVLARPWRGILVEPVPYVFARLRENYAGLERVILENVAIAERDGRLPFYHLAPAAPGERGTLPVWYDGTGSFERAVVERHARHIPDLQRRLVRTEVPSMTFASLCRKHGVRRVDLLAVDTEGYDAEVLRSVDWGTYRPRLVVYEHYHLAAVERMACRAAMERRGYATMEEGFDTWCLERTVEDRLARAWRRARPAVPGVSVHDELA